MKKKIINYGSQYLNREDHESVLKVLKSDYLTQGPFVEKFETELSKYFDTKYVLAVNSGTAALHLSLKSLNLKPNTCVLTTPITFSATCSSILMNNLRPVLSDINFDNYTLDINLVEDKIKKNKKIKVIIGVDYAGYPCDWKSLKYLKNKYNLFLINDNCHAIGSKYYNNRGYASKYADIVCHSYHPVKNFTTGEGGAILTNNKIIYEKVKKFRSHGIWKNKSSNIVGPWHYNIDEYGYNYRISDIQCALGISQLKKLTSFVNQRKKIASVYDHSFSDILNIKAPNVRHKYISHSYHLYPLLINFKKFKITKKIFFEKLLKKGIQLQVHYIPLYKHKFLSKFFKNKIFENSEKFYNQEVSLPIYYKLTRSDQNFVIKSLKEVLKIK